MARHAVRGSIFRESLRGIIARLCEAGRGLWSRRDGGEEPVRFIAGHAGSLCA